MQHSSTPPFTQQPSRSRSTMSSIWAPQPQSSDSTWPKSMESFASVSESDNMRHRTACSLGPTEEDIFGPPGFNNANRRKPVGAIGDGRKPNTASDFDDSHVQQLLRTLNLNSPAPYIQTTSLSATANDSPDLSPSSAHSALLTPIDLSPARSFDVKLSPAYDFHLPSQLQALHQGEQDGQINSASAEAFNPAHLPPNRQGQHNDASSPRINTFPFFEPFVDSSTHSVGQHPTYGSSLNSRVDSSRMSLNWRQPQLPSSDNWMRSEDRPMGDYGLGLSIEDRPLRTSVPSHATAVSSQAHEPINFLSLLHPSSSPPYHVFVARIIKSSDQQASIFLQQKLKVADVQERVKIVDAICARGFEMMAHRFGNWAVQRCLEAASSPEERRKIVACMRGRVVDLATNCYGCHVLQKALDCEEDIRLLIVSELLLGDPAQTLVNKHASHVWSKIMELSWTPPAPPIFAYVNKALKGKWAALACHETGSLVVQHAFENLEETAKDDIVNELLNQGPVTFGQIAKNQWGSYCVQHILEHGSVKHKRLALDHLLAGLLEYATNEQGAKSVTKALKEGGKATLDQIIGRMCEPAKGGRRATIVDLALSATGSQLIASVLPHADKDQRSLLYEAIRGHIVTLRGCKTGSKVIWLFDRMRAYYGY
ncbi:ARM repeat-containing protein [Neolentinus lepideus HHB14362 ss-1]|uniref:ARM repeat-containing protein n=1 Tax=Neolentinus lepideus HHB14362 ss-1 TaxID=1314782 RepID=A0A165U4Z5_9AGAM|nr:ARM repeat-containing protein [Neolentinus lepideus HHB14362 ss-1]